MEAGLPREVPSDGHLDMWNVQPDEAQQEHLPEGWDIKYRKGKKCFMNQLTGEVTESARAHSYILSEQG